MDKNFYFITLTYNYLSYLGKYENKVSNKVGRPFIGIVLNIEGKEYFAPLSSPKEKYKYMKNDIDFIKIYNGKLGVINLNNMIPVINDESCRNKINLNLLLKSNNIDDKKYGFLLIDQLKFCKKNKNMILNKALKLYQIYTKSFEELTNIEKKRYSRINNFKILEFASKEYEKKYIKNDKF